MEVTSHGLAADPHLAGGVREQQSLGQAQADRFLLLRRELVERSRHVQTQAPGVFGMRMKLRLLREEAAGTAGVVLLGEVLEAFQHLLRGV